MLFYCHQPILRSSEAMDGDAIVLLEITAIVAVSMAYARFVSSSTRPGTLRLLSLLPVIILLPFLPWRLSSIQLRGVAAFFLVWLGVFKLLLLSFSLGPLFPSLPLSSFLAVSSLPVKLRRNFSKPPPEHHIHNLLFSFLLRLIFLTLLMPLYEYKHTFHHYLLLLIYCLHIYLMFWYLSRAGPTGEVTCFFLLHGVSLLVEGMGRRRGWGGRTRKEVATVGYVVGTAYWLFFPQLVRAGADRVAVEECTAAVRFMEETGRVSVGRLGRVVGWA